MKKALATILALVMAIGLCSVSWATEPASVNSAETLKTAVEAGGEITLDKDIEISETISVSKPVTINLNNQTITGKNGEYGRRVFNVVAGGSLTLTGSGTITTASNNDDTTFPDNSSVIRVGDNTSGAECRLVVGKDVKIIAPASYGIAVFGKNTKQTLEVSGTVTAKEASAISGNGSAGFTATEITINDGATITSENNVAVYHPQAGTLTVKAATITGRGGIEIKSGTANVNVAGANIKATGNVDHTGNNDGTSSRGYAIAVVENPGYKGKPSAVIQNGNFVGAMGILSDGDVSADAKGNLEIHAGSFTVNVSDYVTGDTPVAATGEQEGTYVVGQSAINAVAKAGNDVRIVKGNVTLTDVPAGVTVIPNEGTTVVVNGKDISSSQYRDGYTVPQSSGYYYYQPTTDTKTTDTKGSPKTFDAGIALYVGMALTSAAGVAFVGKKRED
ncbi:MAG: hypothetical protein ACLUEM_08450 [Oscillospiraceae bacterium]